MSASAPESTRQELETTDPDAANAALASLYGDVRSWLFGDATGFSYRLRSASISQLATARMRFSMGVGVEADLAPTHHTLLVMLGGDHYHLRSQYGDLLLQAGDVAVVPAGAAVRASLKALDVVTLSLPVTEVDRTAEELFGLPAGELAVSDMAPTTPRNARYVRRLVGLASSELLADDPALESPLIYAETLRGLCSGFLAAFRTTATGAGDRRGPGDVAPRALRQAVAFIEDHAGGPLTLSDIAGAAGTSARAVQHAFARHHGTTPMGFVRRVRLERAHRELGVADPTSGETVATIASRWGFTSPGRFAGDYRDAFGVYPSQTLRA